MESQEVVENYKAEVFDFNLYSRLAELEKDETLRNTLRRIAEMERSHAETWTKVAKEKGVRLPERPLSPADRLRASYYLALRRLMGSKLFYKYLDYKEGQDSEKYLAYSQSKDLSDRLREEMKRLAVEEAIHERVFRSVELGYSAEFVYGISDGLIEVLAAVSGLSGAVSSPTLVALGGLIIGVSGSLSMGIGAYLSSKIEEEGKEAELRSIELEKRLDPKVVEERLKEFLRESGLQGKLEAKALIGVAEKLLVKKEETNARKGALVTMVSYFTGALIPTLPFALGLGGLIGTVTSYILGLASTTLVGYLIGVVSMVNAKKKALQMTGLALGAALATHAIGMIANHLLGLSGI
jgi:VIT1/CCC1 family predicted Fe2+/Mn2+ transporter